MHTDEYEISLSREMALCRKRIRQLQESLDRREKQWGMTTAALLQAPEAGCRSEPHLAAEWKREYQDLQYWQKTLTEYQKVLANLKRL
jgi:hypothetical protein